jgi:hypothetical protein
MLPTDFLYAAGVYPGSVFLWPMSHAIPGFLAMWLAAQALRLARPQSPHEIALERLPAALEGHLERHPGLWQVSGIDPAAVRRLGMARGYADSDSPGSGLRARSNQMIFCLSPELRGVCLMPGQPVLLC